MASKDHIVAEQVHARPHILVVQTASNASDITLDYKGKAVNLNQSWCYEPGVGQGADATIRRRC